MRMVDEQAGIESAGVGGPAKAGCVQSSSSQCRPVDAWGCISYGMRVAILKASDVFSAAQNDVTSAE